MDNSWLIHLIRISLRTYKKLALFAAQQKKGTNALPCKKKILLFMKATKTIHHEALYITLFIPFKETKRWLVLFFISIFRLTHSQHSIIGLVYG